jgi:DNA-binding cell septation regulator SpoVG
MAERTIQVLRAQRRPATQEDRGRGVLAYITAELVGGLVLDGLTLRRAESGAVYIAYPARRGRDGERRYAYRPINEEARQRLERAIFATIQVGEGTE